ncbi:unnamed protein product [Trypanosoma congolense IL3000]|uniref:WGS project CAEQ00000000 data, annotated contig 1440 n=1 Tax=Trypanosoma congolense (strain IL3000) TaxID=1068625 RepID=F9W6A0_TRYCI|nr:unnamed protein product [Trypanosoma congolense IL3000]
MTTRHRGHMATLVFCGKMSTLRHWTHVTLNCRMGVTAAQSGQRTDGAPIGYASVTWQPWQAICPVQYRSGGMNQLVLPCYATCNVYICIYMCVCVSCVTCACSLFALLQIPLKLLSQDPFYSFLLSKFLLFFYFSRYCVGFSQFEGFFAACGVCSIV